MNTTTPNSRKAVAHKRQSEQRRIMIILITIVLIIFSLGTVFGCFLCSAFTSEPINAAEITEPETTEPAETALALCTLDIKSTERSLDFELQKTMLEMCEKYELPFALALAVAEQESRFDPNAVSTTDDYGLMQINKVNFKWLREKGIEPLDPKGNIEAGVLMLSEAVKKHSDYGLALMAYNCGDAGAKRLWKKGIYSTEYSRATMERFDKWDKYIKGV